MNIFKGSAKVVSLLVAMAFTTTSMGCVDGTTVKESNRVEVAVVEEVVVGDAVCQDCEEGADDASFDLQLALDELDSDDPAFEELEESAFELLSNPVKICKAILDLKKAVEAMRKAKKAYAAWKAASAATKCIKAGIAIAELGAAIAIIVVAIDTFTKKEKDCGLTPAEKQMLEDLKKGQAKLEALAKEQALRDSAAQCPVPPGPAPLPGK